MATEGTPVLIKALTKRFGRVTAVDNLSLTINSRELFTLLGPSGCGKTTLLRLISGLETQDSGEIYFGDRKISNLPPHKRGIGLVFQSYALFPFLNVFDNIAYGLKTQKIPGHKIKKMVGEAIAIVRLEGLEHRLINQLSGGQRQRVAVARALVTRPKVLLMDEPLSNLDAKLRVNMRGDIKRLQKTLGATTVYVTHDQEEALSISDRVAVMSSGKILQVGTPFEVYNSPVNVFVAGFIGEANILDAVLVGQKDGYSIIKIGDYLLKSRSSVDDKVTMLAASIKFEDIEIVEDIATYDNFLSGVVKEALYLGWGMRYTVEISENVCLYIRSIGADRKAIKHEGDTVKIFVDPEKIQLLAKE